MMIVRTLALGLFSIVCLVAMAVLLVYCRLLGRRRPLLQASSWAMGVSRSILGLKVHVEGPEHVPEGQPAVFMANHASFLDGMILFRLIPGPPHAVIKASVTRFPILGWSMRYVGFVPIDRTRGGGSAGMEKAAERMRTRGDSFLIFPEGTRTRDGRLQSFRRGGLFLAAAAGAPVVPVSIDGTFRLMPRGRIIPRRGDIRVTFHPALDPADMTPEKMPVALDRIRNAVASGLKGEGL